MPRHRSWLLTAAAVVTILVLGLVIRNQIRVYRNRLKGAEERRARELVVERRQTLYDMLRPVALTNCRLERFGEAHDGGYLMCANLLGSVQSAYSYGISGYDQWGCDLSTRLKVPLHQYDCFDTTEPACPTGQPMFHAECVGNAARIDQGRAFDTIANQIARNGDGGKRIVLKIDVEGAEWDSFTATPDDILQRIDQLVVEFHWVHDDEKQQWVPDGEKYLRVMSRLKGFFHVAHVHHNNYSCVSGLEPFPAWAYEVLFVSKRLGVADPASPVPGVTSLDAPNNPQIDDCQAAIHQAMVGVR